jgi:hypothetical protein
VLSFLIFKTEIITVFMAGHQWLTPVILSTQETEIWRIADRSQPGQIVHKALSQKIPNPWLKWLKFACLTNVRT